MLYANNSGVLKAPDSLGQVVVQLATLRSSGRPKKDDHIRATNRQGGRTRTYFVLYSSHPMNKRKVHVAPTMAAASQKERVKDSCALLFYKGADEISTRDYAMADLLQMVEDALVYLDAGEIRPEPANTQRKKGAV